VMDLLEETVVALSEDSAVAGDIQDSGALSVTEDGTVVAVDVSQLDNVTISQVKAIIHSGLDVPEPFVYEGIEVTITELCYEDDMLKVVLSADCPTDNPYYFHNPPLQVITSAAVGDPFTDPDNYIPCGVADAPDTTLQQIVGNAVLDVARQMGWTP
jgi:hypothetical protein